MNFQSNNRIKSFLKKVSLLLIGGILMCALSGCYKSSDAIEGYFSEFRYLYPTTNLMSFLDKTGGYTGNPDDKGTWILSSSHSYTINQTLHMETVILKFNKNTNKVTGDYIIYSFYDDINNKVKRDDKRYPISYDENGIHLETEVEDEQLKNKILNFKFLIEYMDFNQEYIKSLPIESQSYNPELPSFTIKYNLNKQDPNMQKFAEFNPDIQLSETPTIEFDGFSESSWTTYSQREFTFNYFEDKEISESVSFKTSDEFDNN